MVEPVPKDDNGGGFSSANSSSSQRNSPSSQRNQLGFGGRLPFLCEDHQATVDLVQLDVWRLDSDWTCFAEEEKEANQQAVVVEEESTTTIAMQPAISFSVGIKACRGSCESFTSNVCPISPRTTAPPLSTPPDRGDFWPSAHTGNQTKPGESATLALEEEEEEASGSTGPHHGTVWTLVVGAIIGWQIAVFT